MKKLLLNKYMMLGMLIILLIIGGTFAFWAWTGQTTDVLVTVDSVKVIYVKGSDITDATLKPTITKEEGILKEIIVSLDRSVANPVTLNFYLDITMLPVELREETFKWELYKNNEYLNSNNFSLPKEGDALNLSTTQYVTTTKDKYKLYIWIDGNVDNPVTMQNHAFSFSLRADGLGAVYEEDDGKTTSKCFAFISDTKTITKYYSNEENNAVNPLCPKDVMIPEKIGGVDVEVLNSAESASTSVFYNQRITSVELPSKLKTIGDYAFYYNKLSGTLTIPKSVVNIGNSAFYGSSGTNQITELIFEPDSALTTIGNRAFTYNKISGVLTIPKLVTSIGNEAFYYNMLSGSLTIPKSVTSIGSSAFHGGPGINQITELIFEPDSVLTTIGNAAFYENKLTGVLSIPKSVVSIGNNVFSGGPETNQITDLIFAPDSALTTIGNKAFYQNKLSGTFSIPKSVVSIGNFAFSGSPETNQITNIIFDPNTLLTTIGNNAFYQNKLSGALSIPKSVTSIGDSAFYGSSTSNQITDIIFDPNTLLTTIGNDAFRGNKLSGILTIPKSVVSIGNGAFSSNNSTIKITEIIFESNSSLTTIGNSAFSDNKLSGTLTIPKSVVSIGEHAFKGTFNGSSNQITEIVFEPNSSLTTIGDYAFYYNKLRGTLTIPKSVVSLGNRVFAGDSGQNQLTGLIFEEGSKLETLNGATFANNKLTEVNIPTTVTSIKGAFSHNMFPEETAIIYGRNADGTIDYTTIASYAGEGKEKFILPNNIKKIEEYAFYDVKADELFIPKSVISLGACSFQVNKSCSYSTNSITFEEGSKLENIGAGSFYGRCVENVNLPESLVTIEGYAFYQNALKSVTIPSNVTAIGDSAFRPFFGDLNSIINKTGRAFDWSGIIGQGTKPTFITGEIKITGSFARTVYITAE